MTEDEARPNLAPVGESDARSHGSRPSRMTVTTLMGSRLGILFESEEANTRALSSAHPIISLYTRKHTLQNYTHDPGRPFANSPSRALHHRHPPTTHPPTTTHGLGRNFNFSTLFPNQHLQRIPTYPIEAHNVK
ncbi:uncharacterized protein UDID_19520 [Ustilago sp. UG-2017a]|nr:uncharacterized protein UDID_19520 [Ustilago sp. UG-2017a]